MSSATALAFLVGVAFLAASPASAATEPVEVFQADGLDHQVITKRALVCVPKFATSGLTTAETIISSDVETGFLQAHNFVAELGAEPAYRSKITVEAKDGRFRVSHTEVAVLMGRTNWLAVKMTDRFANRLNYQSSKIATCIQDGPVANDF